MTTVPDTLVYTIGGGVLTGAVGMLFFFVKRYFSRSEEDLKKNRDDIAKMLCEVSTYRVGMSESHAQIKATCDGISTALSDIYKKTSHNDAKTTDLSKDLARMEGRLDEHLSMLSNYIQAISHMTKQVNALFKYVDADKRATDIQRKEGTG